MKTERRAGPISPVVVEVAAGYWLWSVGGSTWYLDLDCRRWIQFPGGIKPPYGGKLLRLPAILSLVESFGSPSMSPLPAIH